MDSDQETVSTIASQHGISEAIVLYTSKLEIRDWVHAKARLLCQDNSKSCKGTPDETRRIAKEYSKAAVLLGTGDAFRTSVLDVERTLHEKGYHNALAFLNGHNENRPCLLHAGIDVPGTVRRFKKNYDKPIERCAVVFLE